MEIISRPVVVKRMPERMNLKQARKFWKEVQPFLNSDRPQVVFDMSQVRHIDAAGIDVLLQCMREAIKRDGDLKLAALSSQSAVVLELTRTGRLFEIYDNSTAAVKSFSSFLPNAIRQLEGDKAAQGVVPIFGPQPLNAGEDSSGADLAA
jgi:anti-anti-sigma factor